MARKKSVIRGCGCFSCRWGMHNSSWGKAQVKNAVQKVRHHTKAALAIGDYDKAIDFMTSTGYTD